ncbi:hypothetical protein REPUB_Repub11eG0107400 [Reevesia pubescens]
MVAAANGAEQTPTETMPETVEELLEAARYNDIDNLKRLASTGVSLDSKDSQGRTALHMAAANGHLDIVEYLIGTGVGLNGFWILISGFMRWTKGHTLGFRALETGTRSMTISIDIAGFGTRWYGLIRNCDLHR